MARKATLRNSAAPIANMVPAANVVDIKTGANMETAYKAADERLAMFGELVARGKMARLDFISACADLYLAKELRAEAGKGKITHTNYAKHAVKQWDLRQNADLEANGVVDPEKSRVAEVGAILRATAARPDIVAFGRAADKAARAKYGDAYTAKTYDAVIKVARAQANDIEHKLSEAKAVATLAPTKAEFDEGKTAAMVAKALEKLIEEGTGANKAAYEAALKIVSPIVDLTSGDAARSKFIAKCVKDGHDAKAAAAFYDARPK